MQPQEKRVYTELEETDRNRKKQRAEQLLALQYNNDTIDSELPTPSTQSTSKGFQNSNATNNPATTIIVPIVEKI